MSGECVVTFDETGGRRPKDHLGPITCGPDERTLCGKRLYPHGYPTPGHRFDPSAAYTCKHCVRITASDV